MHSGRKRSFPGIADTFYLWDGGIAKGKRLEQNKSKEREKEKKESKKNNLTRSKAPFGNFKTYALLLLKALIFFLLLKRSP